MRYLQQATGTCGICMEDVRIEHPDKIIRGKDKSQIGYYIPSCPHVFCSACLAQYLEMKLKEPVTTFPVKCPYHKCENTIQDKLAQRVLDMDTMETWWDKQVEAAMDNKIYCPHPDCSVPLENTLIESGCDTMAECPACNRALCTSCRSSWHAGIEISIKCLEVRI